MRTRYFWKAALIACALPLSLSIALPVQAQRHEEHRPIPRGDVDRGIRRVERASNAFRHAYEEADEHHRLPPGDNADLKDGIQRLDESLEKLRSDFNATQDWLTTHDQVQEVLHRARPVDRALIHRPGVLRMFRGKWNVVHSELNRLALTYHLDPLPSRWDRDDDFDHPHHDRDR